MCIRDSAYTEEENRLLDGEPPVTGSRFERGERPRDGGTNVVAEASDACPIPAARPAIAHS